LAAVHHNRLDQLFSIKKKNILSIFCTAGYPQLSNTIEVMKALQDNGADMIEVGMPYSDPLADGPVIQESSHVALANGMTIAVLFEQLKHLRDEIRVPVLLMGYMNPVLQYGFERFCSDASSVGIDGIILPDLPMHEFEKDYKVIVEQNHLHFIFLVTPETGEERIRKIDELSSGFIYAVSSSSTTGHAQEILENKANGVQQSYFKRLHDMNLNNPFLVGFGVKDAQTFDAACKYSRGAIIGSAYIRALGAGEDFRQTTKEFLNSIRK
jgi:tryptophan synthase alpha chain